MESPRISPQAKAYAKAKGLSEIEAIDIHCAMVGLPKPSDRIAVKKLFESRGFNIEYWTEEAITSTLCDYANDRLAKGLACQPISLWPHEKLPLVEAMRVWALTFEGRSEPAEFCLDLIRLGPLACLELDPFETPKAIRKRIERVNKASQDQIWMISYSSKTGIGIELRPLKWNEPGTN